MEQRGDQVRDHETAKALEFWVCITSLMEWILFWLKGCDREAVPSLRSLRFLSAPMSRGCKNFLHKRQQRERRSFARSF